MLRLYPSWATPQTSKIPSMADQIFGQLAAFPAPPLLVVLILTTIPIMLVRNWRITLPALMIQYVLLGLLLARVLPNVAVAIKPVVGIIAGLTLSFAAQRADVERAHRGQANATAQSRLFSANWHNLPSQLLMRLVVMLLVLTAAFGATTRFPLPGNARELAFAAYLLVICGMLIAATVSEGLNVGIGILMMISGFELGYIPLERSISVSVLLGLMTLAVTLSIAYLTLAEADALYLGTREREMMSRRGGGPNLPAVTTTTALPGANSE